MRVRTVMAGIAMVSMVAACDGPSATSTTTSAASTSSAANPTGYLPSEDLACVYIDNVLAIHAEDGGALTDAVEAARGALEALGISHSDTSAVSVLSAVGDNSPAEATSSTPFAPGDGGEFEEAHALIDETLGLLVINADPMLTARTLRADFGIRAAPIHGAGFVGHYKFAPGDEPDGPLPEPLTASNADSTSPDFGYVAVVDSGVAEGGESPPWLFGSGNILYSESDTESTTAGPSHGTFVAGLIRQIASSHAVSVTAARPADQGRIESYPAGDMTVLPTNLTTELHIFEAIARLIGRHRALDSVPVALNLSLGTYTCDLADDGTLTVAEDDSVLVLASAIETWLETFGANVYAAAGNESFSYQGRYVSFWPAALSDVDGIGAANQEGMEVVWERSPAGDTVVDVSGERPWVSAAAPGVDLLGIGAGNGDVYSWSGSSFATAVASAMSALGMSPGPSYTNVPNLAFVP